MKPQSPATSAAHTADTREPAMVRIPRRNFEIGKCPVTQKEWRDVMGNNPSHFKDGGDACPVEQVSWYDVQEFIRKLNAMTGKQYRLPTVDEWVYACHGGSETGPRGRDDVNAVAWYYGNSNGTTHPVGLKQANGYGLYDMFGNVCEWMEDIQYEESDTREVRGGSWLHDQMMVRGLGHMGGAPAEARYKTIGFRLARPGTFTEAGPDSSPSRNMS